MTVIGKILTFLVFFMSLVFLGFAVSINVLNKDPITKKSWYDVAKEYRDKTIPSLQKDIQARDRIIVDLRAKIAEQLEPEIQKIKENFAKELEQARDEAADAKAKAEEAIAKFKKAQDAADNLAIELQKRREEALAQYELQKQKDLALADLRAQITKITNEKIQAQVAAATFRDRVQTLEKQNRELVQALESEREKTAERLEVAGGKELIRRPPPDDVQGTIKAIGRDGLVAITIGSDHGLLRGHTLEVFRTQPKAQYLGVIRLVEVKPHEAVGVMLTPQFRNLIRKGDQVASRILSP